MPGATGPQKQPAIRLGLRQIGGFREDMAECISLARSRHAYIDVEDLCARAGLDARHQALLADAGALKGLVGHRHRARWAVEGVEKQLPLFGANSVRDDPVSLPVPSAGDDTLADYASVWAYPRYDIRCRCCAGSSARNVVAARATCRHYRTARRCAWPGW